MKNIITQKVVIVPVIFTGFTCLLSVFLPLPAVFYVLFLSALFLVFYVVEVRRSNRRLQQLSRRIEDILHGQQQLLIADNEEGDLSVLCSQIHKMTVRLKQQNDALAREQLRMSEALADISHQLRTPLTSMNLTLTSLLSGDLTPAERAEALHRLQRGLVHIDFLIEALLKLSKIDAGTARFEKKAISVAKLIETAVHPLLIPMELHGQQLRVQTSDEVFIGDFSWSAEALTNLIKNCVEHTPPGGLIEVLGSETPIYTQIVIQDNGPGFAQQDLARIFERFYKGKNARPESVGIGLALARSVIAAQNGTIRALNRPEGGAKFIIRFYKGIV